MSAPTFSPDKAAREEALSTIRELVEKHVAAVKTGEADEYNEAQVRISFIDPLLRALQWDTASPTEVTVEERLLEGHCDYTLRIPGDRRPRVFIEAKRFNLGPKGLDGHTYRGGRPLPFPVQAIRYAWQMAAEWAVLTNFKETRLYSSYVSPADPESGLVFTIDIKDFESRFDELWLLGKESVRTGALDALPKKRARETIHEEAPSDLFECRNALATDIHHINPGIDTAEVQQAAQRILDRLIVMRAAEDRRIIPAETLSSLHTTWKGTLIDPSSLFIKSLRHQFEQFDSVYNSEMFAPGHICDRISVSNPVMERVLQVLYEYNFDLIDADILGSIYEGYLTFVLEEEKGELTIHREEAARQQHGVYYTPTYVVEYLVDHALGPSLAMPDAAHLGAIRLLDPACGSGSFLIKAFDRIAEQYVRLNERARAAAKGRKTIEEHGERETEIHDYRERVLRENLYGVDRDSQAAEIAAINLMLKALQPGEKLPLILRENIRIGDSLISRDDQELQIYFGNDWKSKLPFRWEQQFPSILGAGRGGFDVVVGNPPYVDSRKIKPDERNYFHDTKRSRSLPFPTAHKKSDLYTLFLELGIRMLRPGGRLAFIIPDKVLTAPYAEELRPYILDTCSIEQILDLTRVRVFPKQKVRNVILVLRKELDPGVRETTVTQVGIVPKGTDLTAGIPEPQEQLSQKVFRTLPDCQFRLEFRNAEHLETALKFENDTVCLRDIYYVNWGFRTGTKEKTRSLITTDPVLPISKRMIFGEDIAGPYDLEWKNQYVTYDPKQLLNPLFPEALASSKIVIRKISGQRGLFAALDNDGLYPFSTVILAMPYHQVAGIKKARVPEGAEARSRHFELGYVLAVLNSQATRFYYDVMISDRLSVVPNHVKKLRVPKAPPEVQTKLSAQAAEIQDLVDRLRDEKRVGEFRRIVSARERRGEDSFGTYVNRLDERTLEVRDRLDQVSKARKIIINSKARDDTLEVEVSYELGHEGERSSGHLVCRLDPPVAAFLDMVLRDMEKADLGSGRPLSKLRAVEVPRFDPDWERHMDVVRDIVATVHRHENSARELQTKIEDIQSEVDREIYSLLKLNECDVQRILKVQSTPVELPIEEEVAEGEEESEDDDSD